jgi:hypothetical protein
MRVLLSRLCVCVRLLSFERARYDVCDGQILMCKKMRALFFVSCARACNEETPPNVVCVHIISRLIFFIFLPKQHDERTRRTVGLAFVAPFSILRVAAAERAERAERAQQRQRRSENFQKKERNTLLASSSSSSLWYFRRREQRTKERERCTRDA